MKKNLMKVLVVLMALVITAAFTACGSSESTDASAAGGGSAGTAEMGETMAKIKESGKIVMGVNATYAPFEFHKTIDGEDKIIGFDIDLGQAIADELGVELEVKDMAFDGLLPALATGKVDFLPGLAYSEERAENASFSQAYHKSEQVVVMQNADAEATAADDELDGKVIGVLKGSAQEKYLSNHYPKAEAYAIGKIPDLIAALKSGKVDGVQLDYVVAALYDKTNDDIQMSKVRYELSDEEDTGSCVLVRKDNNEDLIAVIDTVIERVKGNGDLQKWEDDVIALMDVGDLPQ